MSIFSRFKNLVSAPSSSASDDPWGLGDHSRSRARTPGKDPSSHDNVLKKRLSKEQRSPGARPAKIKQPVPRVFMDAINASLDRVLPQDTTLVRELNCIDQELEHRLKSLRDSPTKTDGGKFTLKTITGLEGDATQGRTDAQIKLHILLENQWHQATRTAAGSPDKVHEVPAAYIIHPADLEKRMKADPARANGKTTLRQQKRAPPTLSTGAADSGLSGRFNKEATRYAHARVVRDDYHKRFVEPGTANQFAGNSSIVDNNNAKPWSTQPPKQPPEDEFADDAKARGKAKADAERERIRTAARSPQWGKWIEKNHLELVESSADQNNCLLISLLQHATGKYSRSALAAHESEARKLRAETPEKLRDIPVGAELTPDCDVVKWAIHEINKTYERKLRLVTIQPRLLSASEGGGAAPFIDYGRDALTEDEEPIVVQSNGSHFQAIKGRPTLITIPELVTLETF